MDLLLAVSQKGAWLEWVRFFLKGVRNRRARASSKRIRYWRCASGITISSWSARSFGVLQQLIDNLFDFSPSITMTTTAQTLKITPAAASANIRKLTEGGVLREVTGRKRDQVFVAHEILKFMGKR